MTTATELEVRKLRENIYGCIDDESWDKVKIRWMTPENIKWLQDNQPKPKKP